MDITTYALLKGKLEALRKDISLIPKFKPTVVSQLPDDPVENTIYLVPSSDIESDNMYTEYIYIDGHMEKLGEQASEIDLSNYYDKTETNALLADKVDATRMINGKSLNEDVTIAAEDIGLGNVDNTPDSEKNVNSALKDSEENVIHETYATKAEVNEIQLYKTPNAIIHGEPTINNGQITNFSTTNYLGLPFAFDMTNKRWEISMMFTTGDTFTTMQNLLGSTFCIIALITTDRKFRFNVSYDGNAWNDEYVSGFTFDPKTNYYVKIKYTGLNYIFSFSLNGIDYQTETFTPSTAQPKFPYPGQVFIGIGGGFRYPFGGKINLNKWEIRINDSIYWEGMDDVGLATRLATDLENVDVEGIERIKSIIDPDIPKNLSELLDDSEHRTVSDADKSKWNNKVDAIVLDEYAKQSSLDATNERINEIELFKFPNATIIGAPTINNGQVSNFSAQNYMKFPFIVNMQGRPFVIDMAFTTGSNVTNQQNILDGADHGIAFAIKNGKFVIVLGSKSGEWNISNGEKASSIAVSPSTTYRVRISWSGTVYKFEYSTNGETYTEDTAMRINSSLSLYPTQIFIGTTSSLLGHFLGIINMNYCSLTISDKIVWTGMDDVGLATRMAVDMSNIDEAGVAKVKEIMKPDLDNKLGVDDTATKATQDSDGNVITSTYATKNNAVDKNFGSTIYNISAGGAARYSKIARIEITNTYANYPIMFEISGRGNDTFKVCVMFVSRNYTDPNLEYFYSDSYINNIIMYIQKVDSGIWEVYARFAESYGTIAIHRIYGTWYDSGRLKVTPIYELVTSLPEGAIQATNYIADIVNTYYELLQRIQALETALLNTTGE